MAQSISLNFLLHSSLAFSQKYFLFSIPSTLSVPWASLSIHYDKLSFLSKLFEANHRCTSLPCSTEIFSSSRKELPFAKERISANLCFAEKHIFFAKSLLKIIAFRVLQKIYFATGSIHWAAVCNFLALSYINTWIGLISIFLT